MERVQSTTSKVLQEPATQPPSWLDERIVALFEQCGVKFSEERNKQIEQWRCDAEGYWKDFARYESEMAEVKDLGDDCLYESQARAIVCAATVFQKILGEKEPRGLTWKITTREGNTHYLVGTSHCATQAMLDEPHLQKALAASDVMIAELSAEELKPIKEMILQRVTAMGYPLSMDIALVDQFQSESKPVLGLETAEEQIQQESKPLPQFQLIARVHRGIRNWQLGNFDNIRVALENLDITREHIDGRTQQWLKNGKDLDGFGLVNYLAQSNRSCTVAVGGFHCADIIKALASARFTVEQMGDKA